MDDVDSMDMASCTYETWRTARKQHECCACGATIQQNERYHHLSGVWDYGPEAYKHCARCWQVYEILKKESCSYEQPLLTLDCEHEYEGTNQEMYALAFMTREEAQNLT